MNKSLYYWDFIGVLSLLLSLLFYPFSSLKYRLGTRNSSRSGVLKPGSTDP